MPLAFPRSLHPSGTSMPEEGSESDARWSWATMTQALACYTGLLRMMRSPRWKHLLRSHAARLREARELETPVRELLAGDDCSLGLLRLQRRQLEVLARKRLSHFTRREGKSLEEVLGRLETLLHEPQPQPPGRDETVLLEGSQGWRQLLSWPGTWVFVLLAITNRYGLERHGNPTPLLVAGGAFVLYFHLRCRGRFWLTSKRLLWQPRFGEPVQVSLESIARGGVSSMPAWGEVRVEGERTLTVRHSGLAGVLTALLDIHRRSPFLGRVDGTPRVSDVSVLPAWRVLDGARPGQKAEPGVAVLRPGYAAFLPAHRAAQIFQRLAGPEARTPEADVTVDLLVEHMRLLPEAEFDAHVQRAVLSSKGELWCADDVRPEAVPGAGQVYRLGAHGVGMEMRPDSAQAEATERIVRRWAA